MMVQTTQLLHIRTALLTYVRHLQSSVETPRVYVTPEYSLMDTKVSIRAEGLSPGSKVTLETVLKKEEERIHFSSLAKFVVPECGTIDTSGVAPVMGSYTGIHSGGPIWSVTPQQGSKLRLWPKDMTAPLEYRLSVTDTDTGQILCYTQASKSYMAQGVIRIDVREAGLVGTLYLPPMCEYRPAPAIITLYGGMNGDRIPEDRAAMLAARGAVTLALAFFGMEHLPMVYSDIDIEYLETAVDWLLARPEVCGSSVGVCGISKGGDLALAMAQFLGSKIAGVCVQGPSSVSVGGKTIYKGETIAESEFVPEMSNSHEGYIFKMKADLKELERQSERQIYFERGSAPVLAIMGTQDTSLDIIKFSIERAKMKGCVHCKLVELPGAGHLIDVPHSPLCQLARHPLIPPGAKIWYGGEPQLHSLAQFKAWDLLTQFFDRTLKLTTK